MATEWNDLVLDFCQQVLPDDPTLVDEVRLAIHHPAAYMSQFAHLWAEGERDVLAWYALIDGLDRRRQSRTIDWREAPADVLGCLDVLLGDRAGNADRWAWVDLARWDEAPTAAFLAVLGDWCRTQGMVLGNLGTGSDSYVLVLIDAARFAALALLAQRLGAGRLTAWSTSAT
jgi:hypothetical protein